MKPLGSKKRRTPVAGHQDCATCHGPDSKLGRAREKERALRLMLEQVIESHAGESVSLKVVGVLARAQGLLDVLDVWDSLVAELGDDR